VCSAGQKNLPNGQAVQDLVDSLLLAPTTYQRTLEAVEPLMSDWPEEDKLSYHSVRRHQKAHLPWDSSEVRQIVERRAKEKGRDIEKSAERLLTAEAFLELVCQRAWEGLVSRNLRVTLRYALQAVQVLEALDRDKGEDRTLADYFVQLDNIINVVREVVPPELQERIARRLEERRAERARAPLTDEPDEVWEEIQKHLASGDV
jgi:uncharacterized protein YeaC (DUF1315 family)